jgi:WD40 repeat protein
MHGVLIGSLLFVLSGPALAGEQKGKTTVQPIQIVKLDRKEPVLYDRDIEPILANKCQFCHSGAVTEGKLDMGSYETLVRGGKRGPALVPGKPAASLLIRLAGKTERPAMPPKNEEPLTPEELALLKLWVEQGAKAPATRREKPKAVLAALPPSVHPVRALALSPDKSRIATGRGNRIHLYDAASGKYLRSLIDSGLTLADNRPAQSAHSSIVESLAYSPDGKRLVSGSYKEAILWDLTTGKILTRWTGFADRVMALAFSPSGTLLATGGGAPTQDGEIKIFDLSSGQLVTDIKNGHSDTVFGLAFSPDGSKLATSSADRFVKTFEVPSGKFLKAFEGHTHHVLDVGWKSDGKLLASAGADNVIKVWDFEKGEQVRSFGNHTKQITRLVFKGKTSEVAVCSGDQSVRFWNIDNGNAGLSIGGSNDFLYALGVSSDGLLVAAGGEEGIVRLYNGTNGKLIKALLPPGVTAGQAKK